MAVQTPAAEKASKVRYWILFLIFVVTVLNYGGRATLPITAPAMKAEFGFSDLQMGYMLSAFSAAYVLAQVPGGLLLDRFGPRRVYAASIFGWSAATFLTAFLGPMAAVAGAFASLFALRFLVGLAEAPAFPGNAKMATAWFPARERGTASAFYNSAQYFAPVVFSPLMAWITQFHGWRDVYLIAGVAGFAIAAVWLRAARSPAETRSVNAAELEYITEGGREAAPAAHLPAGEVRKYIPRLLTHRTFLGAYIAQYCVNVLTYFFLTWFPLYLVYDRHMTILHAGLVASLPAICGFIGGILGGVFSDRLIRRGLSLTAARKIPIVIGMLLSTVMIGCNYATADWLVIALMALSFFGKGLGALGWAVISDTAPRELVGLSGSVFNMFGNLAGIVTPIVIGYIVASTGSFNGALIFVGLTAVVAVLSYLLIVGEIRRVTLSDLLPRQAG